MEDLKPDRELIRSTDVTASGSHFLKDFAVCAQKGARSHFYQHPNMGADPDYSFGVAPVYTSPNLLFGSSLHSGLEAWYRSRVRDGVDTGEGDLDRAVAAADAEWANRGSELSPTEDLATYASSVRLLLTRYHEHFTLGGPLSDFPSLKVLIDEEGEPWIERHFEIPLFDRFTYTARIDLVVTYNGFLAVMDHKSSKASFVSQLLTQAELEAQFTGQLLCIKHARPDLPISGILINALVKDRRKGPPFERALVHRSPDTLNLYATHTYDLFARIERWKEGFESLLDLGFEYEEAFQRAYPMDGLRHGGCYAYYRKCAFWDLCVAPKMGARLIANSTKPKRRVINELTEKEL